MTTPQTAAFHRLLADAHLGGQAKVDALVVLIQRTLFVVPWPGGIEGYRTLVSSDGVAALPIFSDRGQLEEAARRYGWLAADGSAPAVEVGARAALNYAIKQNLSYVVLDIAAEHSLEVARGEFEPLLTPAARRESAGPYAAAGRISSSLIRAVRPTPPPGSISPVTRRRSEPPPGITAPTNVPGLTASKAFDPAAAATFGGGTSVTLSPLSGVPTDELFDALTAVLREFPEVEWAALVNAARGPSAPAPTVGVRIDTSYRQRVNEIVGALRRAGDSLGAALDVLLLDDAVLMRDARGQGVVFFPWRK